MMKAFLLNNDALLLLELMIRIFIAVTCGGAIGYERKNRGKGAGMRTHIIVAVAACFMMIISQYGFKSFFNDFDNQYVDLRLDPSRIAAQIVTGIGFLGAGIISIQKNNVTGLTTAAGIWATAGIGMGIGCGMYFMSIICTFTIVIIQIILHNKKFKIFNSAVEEDMTFVVADNFDNLDTLTKTLALYDISILNIGYKKLDDEQLQITLTVQFFGELERLKIAEHLYFDKAIKSISI